MKRETLLIGTSLLLLIAAGVFSISAWQRSSENFDQSYYYDLSEKKLLVAARELIPPIRGINDPTEDAVRAVVISVNGDPKAKSGRRIAYLEKYSPELKAEMEAARANGTTPAMGRAAAQAHRFVKRVDDPDWNSLDSELGMQIVNEWISWGTNGLTPVVCTP